MSFWGRWFGAPERISIVYPHARVNLNVAPATLAILGRQEHVLAASTILADGGIPVFYLSADLGLSEKQARVIAHELSHVAARMLKIEDRTHDVDEGVIR